LSVRFTVYILEIVRAVADAAKIINGK